VKKRNNTKGQSWFFLPVLLLLFTLSCKQKTVSEYSYHQPGYYVKLLSFSEKQKTCKGPCVAWLDVAFSTQADSVFWDSYNNLGDRYYLAVDSNDKQNFLAHYVSRCAEGDSFCLLTNPAAFYRQQFKSDRLPFFSEHDTIVKAYVKVKSLMSEKDFESLTRDFLDNERSQILKFYGTIPEAEAALTPEGYYLVDPPEPFYAEEVSVGDQVTISYAGYFLNGKLLERSSSDFSFTYGAPGQVLDGLNIVIGRLNVGQTVKIILPSPLAFGEKGSSDKTVPPFTPLLYELKLKSINKYPSP